MSDIKLASAAEDVKIWDSSDFKICHQYTTKFAPAFQCVHWSPDLQQIVSVPSQGDRICLTLMRPTLLQHADFSTEENNTVCKFSNNTSRIMAIGTKSGSVLVWDIRHNKCLKSFKTVHNGEVTCLQFSGNDNYISAGYSDGNLILHNTMTGQSNSPLGSKAGHAIKSLRYSFLKKSLLGCASVNGEVTLWDTNARQMVTKFSCHVAPCTGLCFSPSNSLLLTSIGLDKKIHCYDIKKKGIVRTIECEAPLTALDFKQDGLVLTAGSSRGTIYVFDLRNPILPLHTVSAHSSSIRSLCFQNTLISAVAKEKKDVLKSSIVEVYEQQSSGYVENKQDNVFVSADPSFKLDSTFDVLRKESLTSEIFSPVKEISLGSRETSLCSRASAISTSDQSICAEIFSPVHPTMDQSNLLSVESIMKSRTSTGNKDQINNVSQIAISDESSMPEHVSDAAKFERTATAAMSSADNAVSYKLSQSSTYGYEVNQAEPPKLAEDIRNLKTEAEHADDNMECDVLEEHPIRNEIAAAAVPSLDLVIDEGKGPSASVTPLTPREFNNEYMKEAIQDAVDDLRDSIKRDMYHFHFQNIQQFMSISKEIGEIKKLLLSLHAE